MRYSKLQKWEEINILKHIWEFPFTFFTINDTVICSYYIWQYFTVKWQMNAMLNHLHFFHYMGRYHTWYHKKKKHLTVGCFCNSFVILFYKNYI